MAPEEKLLREWLRAQLMVRGRGSTSALARYLGFSTPNPISRMLNTNPEKEMRKISASELARMEKFFGTPAPTGTLSGRSQQLSEEERLIQEGMKIWDRLSPEGRLRYLRQVLGEAEPDQSEPSS